MCGGLGVNGALYVPKLYASSGKDISKCIEGGSMKLATQVDYALALATLMSKLFESVILLKCETFLETCPNQFGFKKGHSTEMCIYVLKEMIEFYKSCNTSVFVTFLDASKAYDKIDHWLL